MNDDRRSVLQMLADGKITADEAERLLGALDQNGPGSSPSATAVATRNAKYLRVAIEDDTAGEATKVNVRVPMALLRAGVRLSSIIPPAAREQVNAEFAKSGMAFDIGALKPENIEELISHLGDLTVDVDSGRSKVRVFCE